MTIRSSPGGEVFGVFDIETAPDPLAMTLMRQASGSRVPAALHQVTAVAMLAAREGEDGSWLIEGLTSLCMPDDSEKAMLLATDGFLAELAEVGGRCVSFNGLSHDLPTLRRRAARNHLFATPGIHPREPMQHVDLMRRCTRGWRDDWPSLKAACAGLGIPVNHAPSDPRGPGVQATRRKCETDVVCTFLLLLYELAIARRTVDPLRTGWQALAAFLDKPRTPAHLAQFARASPF